MIGETSEMNDAELDVVVGGMTITKIADAASPNLWTSSCGGGGGHSPPSNGETYQQTLDLLIKAMGA